EQTLLTVTLTPATRRPRRSRLFPYTTLFRSSDVGGESVLDRFEHARSDPRSQGSRTSRQGHDDRRSHHGRRLLASRRQDRPGGRSEEHTSELQSQSNLVCRLLLEKKKNSPDN